MAGWDRDAAVAAYVDALEGMRALAHEVDFGCWGDATDLPGWSVQDSFAHVASIESSLLGREDPEHEPDFDALPHVGDNWVKRHLERGVDLRRSRSPEDIRAELDEVVAARVAEIAGLPVDPEALVTGVLGNPRPVSGVVPVRAFDVWAHEQDVRRAVGLAERLTGPAAEASRDRIVMALPDVVEEAALHEGTTVRWVVTGEQELSIAVRAAGDGAEHVDHDLADDVGAEAAAADDDATLTMDWSTFAQLACGRIEPSRARVSVDGDVSLAEKVLAHMAITP